MSYAARVFRIALAPTVFVTLLVSLGASLGCGGGSGNYVWVDDIPTASANDTDFKIRTTDTVSIRVFGQDNLSTQQRVRPDGKISVPVIGDVVALGKRPADLARELEEKMKSIVVVPKVSVSVDGSAQITISVLGEVRNAGAFPVDPQSSVLQALASAGGLSDYADQDRIFVLRKGEKRRIRFRFSDLRDADPKSVAFSLQAGDVVIVE